MSWNARGLRWPERQVDCLLPPTWGKHRSVPVRGFYQRDDDWWRSWVLPGNRYSTSCFSCARRSGLQKAAPLASAVGTFLAALTVFCVDHRYLWTMIIMLGWVGGVLMQIIAGAISCTRA